METLISLYYYWRENPGLIKDVCTSPQIIFSATALIAIGRQLIKNAREHTNDHDVFEAAGLPMHKRGTSRKNYP